MAKDSRLTLQQFIGALERHLEAVSSRRGEEDPAVDLAYERLQEAFLDYEESLQEQFSEYLPFELAEDE
ncbi:MAG: hypothetical protein RIT51_266 [Actinomycetota bacterium]|jgi:hypothetical protein